MLSLLGMHTPCNAGTMLKSKLDKLCKEGILHKVDISEPIEWL